jgi:succinate dehydrogenase / fumarate reductase, cytochrome b subunit
MYLRDFWMRRLHSLTGVVPVGAFLAEHMLTNSRAGQGKEAYNGAVDFLQSLPYVLWLEIFVIFVPILFHAALGTYFALQSRPNPIRAPYPRNWMHLLQRATGVFLVFYIGWHLWETRVQAALDPSLKLNFFDFMAAKFQNPWYLGFQAAGVLAAVFHLANGLWTFLIVWGITVSRKAQQWAGVACYGAGLVLLLMAFDSFRGFLSAGGG